MIFFHKESKSSGGGAVGWRGGGGGRWMDSRTGLTQFAPSTSSKLGA